MAVSTTIRVFRHMWVSSYMAILFGPVRRSPLVVARRKAGRLC